MPQILTTNDFSNGHCHGPIKAIGPGSPNVFIGNAPVLTQGDLFANSSCGDSSHPSTGANLCVVLGYSNVFVNNKPVFRTGDLISCGDSGGPSSNLVFAN